MTDSLYVLIGLTLSTYLVYRWFNGVTIADIPGPEPESWSLGTHD